MGKTKVKIFNILKKLLLVPEGSVLFQTGSRNVYGLNLASIQFFSNFLYNGRALYINA